MRLYQKIKSINTACRQAKLNMAFDTALVSFYEKLHYSLREKSGITNLYPALSAKSRNSSRNDKTVEADLS